MTIPQGTDDIQRNVSNSGDPTQVVGIPGSGGGAYTWTTIGLPALGNFLSFQYYYGMQATGFETPYATPGPISERTKSAEQIAYETRKARLIAAVEAMKRSAPNWSGSASTVNNLSAQSAEKFLNCLPGNAVLPRVAPDGEGDVMFVWDGPQSCVVTVEKRALHLACRLGTPQMMQLDARRFLGVQIPAAILEHIPSK
jgi:hypothetical protein